MDPVSIFAMGLALAGGVFGAGAQKRSGSRQAALNLWQANQEGQAAYAEAGEIGQLALTRAQRQSKEYQIAAYIADQNAQIVRMRGNAQENRVREETDRKVAGAVAYYAGGNLDVSRGSPLVAATYSAAQGEMDAQITRADTLIEVAGQRWNQYAATAAETDAWSTALETINSAFSAAGRRDTTAMNTARVNASNAIRTGELGAAATLLTTGTRIATTLGSMGAGSSAWNSFKEFMVPGMKF